MAKKRAITSKKKKKKIKNKPTPSIPHLCEHGIRMWNCIYISKIPSPVVIIVCCVCVCVWYFNWYNIVRAAYSMRDGVFCSFISFFELWYGEIQQWRKWNAEITFSSNWMGKKTNRMSKIMAIFEYIHTVCTVNGWGYRVKSKFYDVNTVDSQ